MDYVNIIINMIHDMITNNTNEESIVNDPSLYIYNIEHPELVTPEKIMFIINIITNNPGITTDEVVECLNEFNQIITRQIIVTNITSKIINKDPIVPIMKLISEQGITVVAVPNSLRVIKHNSDIKTDINKINQNVESIYINFGMLINTKNNISYSLFQDEKLHKFNYLCGRFVLKSSNDPFIESVVISNKIIQRLPYSVKIDTIGVFGKSQYKIFIDILQDVNLDKLSYVTILKLYSVLLSTNYNVHIDRLLQSLMKCRFNTISQQGGNLDIKWRAINCIVEYIECKHISTLETCLKPSPTILDNLNEFIATYGKLIDHSYYCNQCGEDFSSIFELSDNSVKITNKKLSYNSISNMFNHEPYKTYTSSLGFVLLQVSAIDTLIHVNMRSSGYNATKYVLDWLLMVNTNIKEYETKYKFELSKGLFFCRLSQDLFSLTYSEKERFSQIKQLNLNVLVVVALIMVSSTEILFQLITHMKLVNININEFIMKLLTKIKIKHDNLDVILEFYLRPLIVLNKERLSYLDKQIIYLSNNNIIKPVRHLVIPVMNAGHNLVDDNPVIHQLQVSNRKHYETYKYSEEPTNVNMIESRKLLVPKMTVTQAENLVKEYSDKITFTLSYDGIMVDNYSLSTENDIEYITLTMGQILVTHMVSILIRNDKFNVNGNDFFRILRMGDMCPFSSVRYQYNDHIRYLAITNYCSGFRDDIDFDEILNLTNSSDSSIRVSMYNIMCLSVIQDFKNT